MSYHTVRSFWVNSLGEFGHKDENLADIDCGGFVNVREVEAAGLTVEQAFQEQRQDICQNASELGLLEEYDRLSVANGRWNVNGGILYKATGPETQLHLATEFSHNVQDELFWRQLNEIAARHKFQVREMWEHPPESGYWKGALPKGFNQLSQEERTKLSSYVPSPDEGVIKLQVECYIDIHGLTPEERDAIIEAFEKDANNLFSLAGVTIL